jgi:teichuronic acid exporter
MSLAKKAILGAGWILAGNTSTQLMAFVINVLLARLLLPQDFGAVAIISSFLAILQVLGEMGLSVAVVQRKDLSEDTLHNAFSLTCISTSIIGIVIWGMAPAVSSFFSNSELTGLFRLAAFSYCFRGIYSFCNCLLLRKLEYRVIALIHLAGVLASGGVSITLAFEGAGAYAVVWGQIASGAIMLTLALFASKYRPKLAWEISEIRSLLSFGLWVSLNRLLNNIAGKIDAMIVGRSIGSAELGQYYLAQRLVLILPSLVTGMLDQVLLPVYSRLQSDTRRIEKGYWDSLLLSSILTVPPVCLIFLFSGELIFLLYGEKWMEIVPLMQIMTVFAFAGCFGGGIFGSVMYAQGKTRSMAVVSTFRVVALPLCLLVGSLWGVKGVAWGFAAYGIIGRLFNQCVLRFFVGYSLVTFIKTIAVPFSISLFTTAAVSFILNTVFPAANDAIPHFLVRIVGGATIWITIYALLLILIFYRKFSEIRKRLHSGVF